MPRAASPIIENAVARSLRRVVVVACSLPSKVRAQAAKASKVCVRGHGFVCGANSSCLCAALLPRFPTKNCFPIG